MNNLSRQVEELLYEAIQSGINPAVNETSVNDVDHTPMASNTSADTTPATSNTVSATTNYHDLLHESIVLYNTNMLRYQENMHDITSLLQSIQTNHASATSTSRNTHPPVFYRTFADMPTTGNTRIPANDTRIPLSTASSTHVGIAPEYINLFTNCIQYDGSMNETRCPISLDDFQVNEHILQIRGCGHIFKSESLRYWFSRNHVCPVCRMHLYERHGLQMPRHTSRTSSTRGNATTIPASIAHLGNLYSESISLGANSTSLFGNVAAYTFSNDMSGNTLGLNAYDNEAINLLFESIVFR